jgi:hypothetical protein
MTLPHRLSGIILAALIVAGGLISASSAKAEDLVDFLWGGSAEYGGGRSVVSFDPKYKPNQIIVSFSDRRLYLITKPGEAITYPVAVPTGEARWQGVTFVSNKRVNPPWTPTPEMVRNNPRLPRWVPGGHPMNPLGIRAMYLGSSAYRIHGTDAPWTIGQAVSHGCIRMTNQDVLDLYPRVPVGMRVTVTWQHFSTHTVASGDEYPRYGADASSNSKNKSTASYSSPRDTSNHTASNRPTDGSLSSLFFWNDDEPAQQSQAPAQKSAHEATTSPAPSKKKTASSATKKKSSSTEKEKVSSSTSSHATSIPDPKKPRESAAADPVATKASLQTGNAPQGMPSATKTSASSDDGLSVKKAAAQVQ